MRSINLTPPVASEYYWPESVLSHIGDVKDLTTSTPEYYEHMPMNHFSSRSLSDKLHRLNLSFRNAALLLKQAPLVKRTFPSLESLKIDCLICASADYDALAHALALLLFESLPPIN